MFMAHPFLIRAISAGDGGFHDKGHLQNGLTP
jgi:hypothetical protein